jgi:hypothetical protein
MRKTVFGWVKNVNIFRKGGLDVCVQLSPISKKFIRFTGLVNGKLSFIRRFIPKHQAYFSTYKYVFSTLLIGFYTHNPQDLLLEP